MPPASHEVKCLACERVIGEIVQGRFARHACGDPPRSAGQVARYCHCGGSLYLEELLELVWDAPAVLTRPHRIGGAVA